MVRATFADEDLHRSGDHLGLGALVDDGLREVGGGHGARSFYDVAAYLVAGPYTVDGTAVKVCGHLFQGDTGPRRAGARRGHDGCADLATRVAVWVETRVGAKR